MQDLEGSYDWGTDSDHPADESHEYLWPAVERALPPGRHRILDAGCGTGEFAARLKALGHDVAGIDASPGGVEIARTRYPGIRFETASLYDDLGAMTPAGGWDLIVAVEVIEHLFSPRRFLDNMRCHLRTGGAIVLTTPYHGYVKNLALSLFDAWDKHHTVDWECGHIKFFSVRTLSAMMASAGFVVSGVSYCGRVPMLWKSMVLRGEGAADPAA